MANINILQMIEQCQVEWKTLGSVLVRTKGTKITAGKMKELHKNDGEIKIFAGGKTFAFVHKGDIPDNDINNQPSIIVKSRGIIEFEYYDKPFSHKNEMWSYYSNNDDINIKFIYHFLKQNEPHFQQIGSKMQMPQIATPDTDKFLIPIPPLPIQKEIVKILDKFTELEATLEATLEAELSLREKQYTFYRDHLLSFGDDVEWKSLGEVAQYSSTRIKFDLINKHNYVGVDNLLQNREGKTVSNYVPTSGNLTQFTAGDILIGNIRPYLKKIWQADCEGGTNGDVLVIRIIDKNVDTRYLYQVLAGDKFFEYNMKHAKGAKMPRGNKQAILQYKIPIPPLTTQQKIVAILDKFETLTHSITEGLPKEIELRRKQYEYYREKLLTFPKQ